MPGSYYSGDTAAGTLPGTWPSRASGLEAAAPAHSLPAYAHPCACACLLTAPVFHMLLRTCVLVRPSPRGLHPHLLGAALGPVPVQALGLDKVDGVLHTVGLKLDEVQPACRGGGWRVGWGACMG